tara:strand:+ start:559 stop:1125 length:567 start_codon:yes stop_codon:yes gene_type:complete
MIADYFIVKNVVTKEECDYLIHKGKQNMYDSEVNSTDQKNGVVNKQTRSSKTSVYKPISREDNSFVLRKLFREKILKTYKDVAFEFYKQPIRFIEDPQFTFYTEKDFFYWHFDSLDQFSQVNRDLSASLILSDSRDYDNGRLGFKMPGGDIEIEEEQGMMIVFPSLFIHRVSQITRGERASIVIWGGL